jgi:hypothetical protein
MKKINQIFYLFIILNLILAVENPWHASAQSGKAQVFLPVTYNRFNSGPGTVAGEIIDASSGLAFSGNKVAKVCYEENCIKTDEAGLFQFTDVPAGAQYFRASADNYYSVGMWFTIIAYQENQLNIVMSQNLSISKVKMRIVTTWSTNQFWPPANFENDLDAFLWVTTAGITPTLVKDVTRTQCTNYPYACRENDARQGTGPETIAIQDFKAGSNYYYGVLNYNQYQPDVPPVSETGASVGVYNEQGLMDTYYVPNQGDGNFWYVFSMDDTGIIHPQNCIIELSPSEGTLPDCSLQPALRVQKMPKKP